MARRSGGFTLLEVLIAVTLLSLVMAALVASMRTFGNTRTTLDRVTARVDEIRTISSFLRGTIGTALPLERPDLFKGEEGEYEAGATFFGGDSTEMVWVSPVIAGTRLGGAYAIHLVHEEDQLMLRWHPYRMDLTEGDWSNLPPRALVESVEEFEISYLPDYGEDWVEEWVPAKHSPAAVRLTIRAAGKYWPELVIRLSGAVER
ncbi:MAG: general secretion pathway protein J [Bacteroidia bacterium]|jgi:general secretion pathway protein J